MQPRCRRIAALHHASAAKRIEINKGRRRSATERGVIVSAPICLFARNSRLKAQWCPAAEVEVCQQAGARYPEVGAEAHTFLAVIADRHGRKQEPGGLSRTCIVCSRRHSDVAGRSPMLARSQCLPARLPGAPCPLPPRLLHVRQSLRLPQRQQRYRPPRCQPRSLWQPGWR